jgi:glycosyltransferase involved in cell wall biosynthesis
MIKLAYFSPLNPVRSGISDYSEDLLPSLADLASVDLFVDDFEPSNQALRERFNVYPIQEYPQRRWDYDMALYHMGNNVYHEAIYRMALRFPGVVVLHDYALVGMISSMTWGQERFGDFVREWGYNYGSDGVTRARKILRGVESMSPAEPLNQRLIDSSLGLIVHSEYVRRNVLAACSLATVARIPMPCVSHQPGPMTRQSARHGLGLDEDKLYVGTFGYIVPNKQVETLLDTLSELMAQFPNAHLLFVGEPLEWYDPWPLIEERGLAHKVTVTGYLSLSTWYTYMPALDLAVNLRYPTMGETSASVLRLLGEGVPTVVSDVGWYAELPDDCVVKIGVGETMRADLRTALTRLLSQPELRAGLGQRGQAYVSAQHAVQQVARQYIDFIRQFVR